MAGRRLKMGAIALVAASAATGVTADCECGYSTHIGDYEHSSVFTELLETDFSQMGDISKNGDWMLPAFDVTSARSGGLLDLNFRAENIVAITNKRKSPTRSEPGMTAKGSQHDDAALDLYVSSKVDQGKISVAGIDTRAADLKYGSYRTSMQLTEEAGTCAAFMWYFNRTQEIDMEFLSNDFNSKNGSYPVNLIVQSPESGKAGYDGMKTGDYIRTDLPFNPTKGFHEYRFDFIPGEVHFYADGKPLAKIQGPAVPHENPGHLVLQHWSDGNDNWSGGPPAKDAAITVRYVKAYYNSTDPARQSESNARCTDSKSGAKSICPIPDIASTKSAENFFFSKTNQTTKSRVSPDKKDKDKNESPRPVDKVDEDSAVMWGVQTGLTAAWGLIAGVAAFMFAL